MELELFFFVGYTTNHLLDGPLENYRCTCSQFCFPQHYRTFFTCDKKCPQGLVINLLFITSHFLTVILKP